MALLPGALLKGGGRWFYHIRTPLNMKVSADRATNKMTPFRECDGLRRFHGFDLGVPLLEERADDLFGVVGVHLTAEGFDMEGLFLPLLFSSFLSIFY